MQFIVSTAWCPPGELLELAQTAEDCGWDGMALSDHVVHPERIATPYPYTPDGSPRWIPSTPWLDPFVSIAAMAAVTTRLRFLTAVYVLPMRNPFNVAKAVATAALLSGQRVALGVGAGWMEEEFRLLEQPFAARGARMHEMIEVLRKLWTGEMVEHHGRFYDFARLQMSPGVGERIPILSGGVSEAALRRVGRLSDGWISEIHTTEQLREIVGRLRRLRAEYGREREPLAVFGTCIDARDVDGFRRLEEIGVTGILAMPWATGDSHCSPPLSEKRQSLRRFADDVIAKLR